MGESKSKSVAVLNSRRASNLPDEHNGQLDTAAAAAVEIQLAVRTPTATRMKDVGELPLPSSSSSSSETQSTSPSVLPRGQVRSLLDDAERDPAEN